MTPIKSAPPEPSPTPEITSEPSPPVAPPPYAHAFRILHQHELAQTEGSEEEDSGEGDPAAVTPREKPGIIVARYVYRWLYNLALAKVYFIFGTLNGLLARRQRPTGRPIRVLRIVSKITQGGVAKVALQTILATPSDQVETWMLVFDEKHATTQSLQQRPEIHLINRKLSLWPGSYKLRLFRHMIKLARVIRRVKPDLIHLHEPQFVTVVRLAAGMAGGVPVCVHMHNDYTVRQRARQRFQQSLQKHALRRSHLIACSQTIYDAAYAFVGKPRWPVALIEDGTDDVPDRAPDPQLARDLARAANGRRIIAKMSHLMPHKRIPDFLMACRILLDEGYPIFVLLMCYGKDRFGEQMLVKFNKFFAPEEGEFLFRVHAPQHLLHQIDIGVSTSSLEGLGLNVLEYQIEGVPVICTDLIPHKEMVTHEQDGLLYETANIAELVRALRRLLGDAELHQRLAQAGQQRARARQWSNTAANMVKFYEGMLGA